MYGRRVFGSRCTPPDGTRVTAHYDTDERVSIQRREATEHCWSLCVGMF